ncbi:MAG: histidine--tRNA ligase [Dehalococcoidia bacterium]
MPLRYKAPRGTADVLPQDQPYWRYVHETAASLCQRFGYAAIETPVFEEVSLFIRGVGKATDIVQKEMYVFKDKGGDTMALRPEGTASVCRAYLQHGMSNLPQPVRLYYIAPIFRYDRPQAGRYRQHTQFGYEAIGEADAAVDAEAVEMAWRLYEDLGLTDLLLQLNSIGDASCRPAYLEALRAYYRPKLERVCPDCQGRYRRNPLRLLDCKEERCQPVIAGAPPLTEHLCQPCADHLSSLRAYLDEISVPYEINPRLVHGLDYYTRTVFEVMPPEEGAQSTIGAGGRYDGLIEELGGRPTPGIGFATGIERIILNLKRQEVPLPMPDAPLVFVAHQTAEARITGYRLASQLRQAGIAAMVATGDRSLKAQMRQADASGARYAAIIGQRELAEGSAVLRRLEDGQQETLPLTDVARRLRPLDPG